MVPVGDASTRVITILGHYLSNLILFLVLYPQTRRQVSTPVANNLRVLRGGDF
jgi:hypothetical protein